MMMMHQTDEDHEEYGRKFVGTVYYELCGMISTDLARLFLRLQITARSFNWSATVAPVSRRLRSVRRDIVSTVVHRLKKSTFTQVNCANHFRLRHRKNLIYSFCWQRESLAFPEKFLTPHFLASGGQNIA